MAQKRVKRSSAGDSYSSYNAYLNNIYNTTEAYKLAPQRAYPPVRTAPKRSNSNKPAAPQRNRQPQRSIDPRKQQVQRQRAYRLNEQKRLNKPTYEFVRQKSPIPVLNIVTVLTISIFAFCWIASLSAIKLSQNKLAASQSEYMDLVKKNENDRYFLDKSIDLNAVAAIASTRLGMQQAEDYQKVRITVPRVSYTVSYEVPEQQEESGFSLAGIFNFFIGK